MKFSIYAEYIHKIIMLPPLTCDYNYPSIVTMVDNNFDFTAFKTLTNIIDIIIK